MKKLSIALLVMVMAFNAMAATSATLYLKGTIAPVLSISIAPETLATTLPLSTSQVETKVAVVTENSNSSTGYKITLSSLNSGVLKRASGTETIPYSLKYGTQGGISLTSPQVVTYANTQAVNAQKDVKISYTGVPASQAAGDYEDTITLTIAVN